MGKGAITEEMLPELFELWDKTGKSAKEIAFHLSMKHHAAITRNMVIGKVHRRREGERVAARRVQKLTPDERRAKQAQERPKAAPPKPGKAVALREPKPAPKPKVDPLHKFEKIKPSNLASNAARAIAELDGCRFPLGDVGDPHFRFCNAEPREGRPYCAAHCAIAYNGIPQPKPKLKLVFAR